MLNRTVFNLPPLNRNALAELPLTAIRPRGWLKAQLETCRSGLTGQLHAFWPDVRDSAWRGGEGDGWERAPYYLDGLVPLAWLLDDAELKAVCMEYIEWTLGSQREDGFFGPEKSPDWWPRMVMLKVLIQYFTATVDKRVPEFMYKYFRYEYAHLDERPMEEWAVARGAENIQSALWLYNLTGGKHRFLLSLCEKLAAQTLDWSTLFSAFPFKRGLQRLIPWEEMVRGRQAEEAQGEKLKGTARPYYHTQYHYSHVVNVAMGLKAPGVISQLRTTSKHLNGFAEGWDKLQRYHGVANGMFTGDEHLSGSSPTQGTETCAVVELMHTVETLFTCGVPTEGLGDILEKAAFNALPGCMTDDMLLHQYDQQANQVRCSDEKHPWYNNSTDANLYGLEPNFGCCTANLHQGWPKYASHLWYATRDEGFACVSYAPCALRYRSGDVPVSLEVETDYPFGETVTIHVRPAEKKAFPLLLRIPGWADRAALAVNGEAQPRTEPDAFCVIERTWEAGDTVTLTLPMTPRVTRWSRRSAAVELGPLLMAFRPVETWTKVKDHPVAPDYAVTSGPDWRWALVDGGRMTARMPQGHSGAFAGEGLPEVICEAVAAPEWTMAGPDAAPTPVGLGLAGREVVEIPLTPYGATGLRISQFPVAGEEPDAAADDE